MDITELWLKLVKFNGFSWEAIWISCEMNLEVLSNSHNLLFIFWKSTKILIINILNIIIINYKHYNIIVKQCVDVWEY